MPDTLSRLTDYSGSTDSARPTDSVDTVDRLWRRAVRVLAPSVLASALGAVMVPTIPTAHASLGACGSDPVVVLSNGVTIDLYATVGDASDDVQQIVYTLHAPHGTSVLSVVYTSSLLGPKEVLQFEADTLPDTYATETVVTTGARGIAVTATTTVVPLLDLPATASTHGYDRQSLHVSVST